MTDKQKNYIRAMERQRDNRQRILFASEEDIQDRSGIYMFYRMDAYCRIIARYIGKSETSVLNRCASHLNGYDSHIDKSIHSHGLWSADNQTGWQVRVLEYCEPFQCDERERFYIGFCQKLGVNLHNIESGGTIGKTDINERKLARGYRDGVKQGERNVIKKIAHLFDLHLTVGYKADKPSKNAIKAMDSFMTLIQGESDNDNNKNNAT